MTAQSRRPPNPLTGPRRPSLNVVLTAVVVVLAAVIFGGILIFGGDDEEPVHQAAVSKTLLPVDANALTQAPADGRQATLVEYVDYQFPACAALYQNLTLQTA